MAKLFDSTGNAVEAFTQDEVNAMVAEHPTLKEAQTKLTEAQQTAADLKKQVDEFAGTDKGQNMAALRQKAEAAQEKADKLAASVVGELGTIKKRLDDAELDKALIAVADGDVEMSKKIKAEYERIVKPEDTEEERRKKMGDAYKLASGYSASPSVMGRIIGSAGAPLAGGGSAATKPELVEFGRRFGLTEDDFKKFGNNK